MMVQGVVTPIGAILRAATRVTCVVTGSPKILGVVTRLPKDFWCGHRVTKVFQHCHTTGHEPCKVRLVHPIMLQVPSSSVAHALSESIVY